MASAGNTNSPQRQHPHPHQKRAAAISTTLEFVKRITMKAYYYDDVPGDCRLPHQSSEPVSSILLSKLGLLYHRLPPQLPSSASELSSLKTARDYKNADTIVVSPEAMGDAYEAKIETFFKEHMHEDEEIRYILEGQGYFDVREKGDERWVRIALEQGDLIVLPAGVYHRFTVGEGNYVKAMRLFKDEPKWTPLNRGEETENNKFRKEYVMAREASFAEGQTV